MVLRNRVCAAVLFVCILCLCTGCSGAAHDGRVKLRVVNWNVETFFDAVADGDEYGEFAKSKNWNEAAYTARLTRLASSIKKLNADVVVMEEIENEAVVQDVANFLAGEWNSRRWYRWGCFAKEPGSAIGCAVISRLPLENLSVHSLDCRSAEGEQPSLRPVLQLEVVKNDRRLTLFVNHWKSMKGGEAETAVWRERQQALLERLVSGTLGEAKQPVLCCGDFNMDVEDFQHDAEGAVVLQGDGSCTEVRSPWFAEDGEMVGDGSYMYQGCWSRIDNFFTAGAAEAVDFRPETDGEWCYEDSGKPKGYKLWTGAGYSDHLPIGVSVLF